MPERRSVRFQSRSVCFLKEDAAHFQRVLLEASPDLRFLPQNYWKVVEREAGKTGGIPRAWPVNLPVPFRDNLHEDDQIFMMAWREPPDWSPIWGRRADSGVMVILNRPERYFCFDRILGPYWQDGRQVLDDGRIWGSHYPDDKEQKAFVAKVVRLVTEVATNKLAGFVPGSRTDLMEIKSCGLWAGPQAIEWCRKDPRRRLGGCRPLEEVETGLPPLPEE